VSEPTPVRQKEPVAAPQPAIGPTAIQTANFLSTYERYKKGFRNSRNASLVACFLSVLAPIVVANDPSPDREGALMPLFVFAGALFAMIQGKTRTLLATLKEQGITTEVLNVIAADEAFRAIQDRKLVEVFGKLLWDRLWLRIAMAVSLFFTPIGLAVL
jgi:hypothetical protein